MLPRYKEIMDLIKKGATIEAQEKIVELRETAIDLQEENQILKAEIKELEAKLKTKGNVVWEKPSYWLVEKKGRDGPFCQRCFDADDHALIRLQGGKNDTWVCMACKSKYHGPNYQPPSGFAVGAARRFSR